MSTECCSPCVWREREQEPGPAQALTVASAPWPAEPLLLLRQYRPSWLTSQHVWMCCLAGNVCATCSSRLSHTLQGTTEPKGTLRHHHHHGFPLCPPTHLAVPTCSAPGCSQTLPACSHSSMLDHSPSFCLTNSPFHLQSPPRTASSPSLAGHCTPRPR